MAKEDFKEIVALEQMNIFLDIIKSILDADTKKDWNELYKPIQIMKKQRLKLINPEGCEKELNQC